MTHKWTAFYLLVWKNFTVARRTPMQTLYKFLYFLLVTLTIICMRIKIFYEKAERPQMVFESFSPSELNFKEFKTIAWSPCKNGNLETIMETVAKNLKLEQECFKNGATMEDSARSSTNYTYFAGVQFLDALADDTPLSKSIDVTLRFPPLLRSLPNLENVKNETWETDDLFSTTLQNLGTAAPQEKVPPPNYDAQNFLLLQQEVSYAIIKHFQSSFDRSSTKITLQRYPYPKWTDDSFYQILSSYMWMLLFVGSQAPFLDLIKAITIEKETQMKETLLIVGFPRWILWASWFFDTFIYLAISVVITVICFKQYDILPHSNPVLILIFFLLYVSATTTFMFSISTLISTSTRAILVPVVIASMTLIPYKLFSGKNSSVMLRILVGLFPNSVFAYVINITLYLDTVTGKGLQWDNMWDKIAPFNDDTVGFGMIMLLTDTIFYMLLALYLEQIIPGEYGIAKKWNFPCTNLCSHEAQEDRELQMNAVNSNVDRASIELDPTHLRAGIKIKRLRKTFDQEVAVDNLTLNMYENQITALLGHNGAGKTTTIMMLIGMYSPSDGTAYVDGYDIRDQMNEIRESIGICPQHNVLFDFLTVEEHLYFFCKLKGMNNVKTRREIKKYLNAIELKDKAKTLSQNLSGGMKRKLSVATALCGQSKIIICDEPSSGMDPSARRSLWDFLQAHKQGRTILLTTHFMDEADVLGDRIAIMAHGKLQCCGTSFFLKKKFGTGYHLIIDKAPGCDVENITLLLRRHIPDITIEMNIGSEVIYMMKGEESRRFERMLGDLEAHGNALGVRNYGISLPTIEEVFMKVGTEGHEQDLVPNPSNLTVGNRFSLVDNAGCCCDGYINQIMAMFIKRFISWKNLWIAFLVVLFGPVLLIVLSEYAKPNLGRSPSKLLIDLSTYDSPLTLIGGAETALRGTYLDVLKKANQKYSLVAAELSHFTQYVLDESEKSLYTYTYKYVVGAFLESKQITVFFNGQAYHSSPLTLSLAMNVLLKEKTSHDHNINIYNHPFDYSKTLTEWEGQMGVEEQIVSTVQQMIITTMLFAIYIFFYVKERASGFKHMQFVCGANPIIFWTVPFICDLLVYTVAVSLALVTARHIQIETFPMPFMPQLLILFIYGFSFFPILYLCSFLFRHPIAAFEILLTVFLITVYLSFVAYVGKQVQILDQKSHELLMFLCPCYACLNAVILVQIYYYAYQLHPDMDLYAWDQPGIGMPLFCMWLQGIVAFVLLILIEYRFWPRIVYCVKHLWMPSPKPSQDVQPDENVMEEIYRVRRMGAAEIRANILTLRNVTKYFGKFLAVNQLCLAVTEQECFGLLGVNGAGKTTTFKMLTGDETISYGDAWIHGRNLKHQMKQAQKMMGYCPQFDAVIEDFTGWETMRIICLLRGISVVYSKDVIHYLADKFNFEHNLHKRISTLSGGNKRKLSVAIAMIGDPQMIYLDEPTSGMDPGTKRYVWNALIQLREEGKCIILTSHSIEECEALCTRLTIMVNGSFVCLGTKQQLKSKYLTKYTITVKMASSREKHIQQLKKFIVEKFSNAELKEEYEKIITYHVGDATIPYSAMFGIMEQGKASLPIEDYSISQCSLEQIFLSFTKHKQQRNASTSAK